MKNTINSALFSQARKYQSSNPLLNAIVLLFILILIPVLIVLGIATLLGIGVYAKIKNLMSTSTKSPLGNKKQEEVEYAEYEVIESETSKPGK